MPGLAAFESFFNGILLNRKRTRGITEGVFLGLLTMTVVLVAGIAGGAMTGVNVAAIGAHRGRVDPGRVALVPVASRHGGRFACRTCSWRRENP